MEIERFILSGKETIKETMRIIDANGYGIAFICQDRKLQGVVSDGDIRRYILKYGDLNACVQVIVNYTPKYLFVDSMENCQEYIRKNRITALPVLDKNHRIVRIELANLSTIYSQKKIKSPVVIMAGGKGSRLYPYTNVLPKPLIPIGEKTITEHIMERFKKVGCSEFFMIVNYKKNLIKTFFNENDEKLDISFVDEEEFWGTGGGLKLLTGLVKDTFFMTNCDILIEDDYSAMLEKHKEQGNIITLVCVSRKVDIPYGIVDIDGEGQVQILREKPSYSILTNTGLYIIEPRFLDKIPSNTFIHITDIIQKCVDHGEKVGTYIVSEDAWLDMGQLEELDKMKRHLELGEK